MTNKHSVRLQLEFKPEETVGCSLLTLSQAHSTDLVRSIHAASSSFVMCCTTANPLSVILFHKKGDDLKLLLKKLALPKGSYTTTKYLFHKNFFEQALLNYVSFRLSKKAWIGTSMRHLMTAALSEDELLHFATSFSTGKTFLYKEPINRYLESNSSSLSFSAVHVDMYLENKEIAETSDSHQHFFVEISVLHGFHGSRFQVDNRLQQRMKDGQDIVLFEMQSFDSKPFIPVEVLSTRAFSFPNFTECNVVGIVDPNPSNKKKLKELAENQMYKSVKSRCTLTQEEIMKHWAEQHGMEISKQAVKHMSEMNFLVQFPGFMLSEMTEKDGQEEQEFVRPMFCYPSPLVFQSLSHNQRRKLPTNENLCTKMKESLLEISGIEGLLFREGEAEKMQPSQSAVPQEALVFIPTFVKATVFSEESFFVSTPQQSVRQDAVNSKQNPQPQIPEAKEVKVSKQAVVVPKAADPKAASKLSTQEAPKAKKTKTSSTENCESTTTKKTKAKKGAEKESTKEKKKKLTAETKRKREAKPKTSKTSKKQKK